MAPTRRTAVNLLPHADLPAVQGLLAEAGIALWAADDGGALILEENTALPDEGYQLSIDENGLRLAARSSAGIFYGAQTIRQLLPVDCAGTAQLPRALPGAACIWMCAATFFPSTL